VAIDALENYSTGTPPKLFSQESRSIFITQDQIINLRSGPDGRGFSDGDNVFLYVTYSEDPTDGVVGKSTRFQLREEVLTIRDTGSGFGLNTNLNIPLGRVALSGGDLTVTPPNNTNRRQATLRLSGAAPGPGATLNSIAVQPANVVLTVGVTQTFQAIGTFSGGTTRPLTSADGLTWSSSSPAIVSITTGTGQAQPLSAGGPVTITATVAAITGTTTVQVQPAAIQPIINFLSPNLQAHDANVEIHGQNIRDATNLPSVSLVKGSVRKSVTNIIARPNDPSGRQVVRITVPDRSGTPWVLNESVTLELQFGGGTANAAFQYDD
jgi:hypothetical protein